MSSRFGFVCYHITTEDRLDRILEEGLQPNASRNRSAKPAPFIMLSLYPYWGLFKGFKKNAQPILIEIQDPAIKRRMFDGDPEGLAYEHTIKPKCFKTIVKFYVLGSK